MAQKRLVIADLRGGRNGGEPPFALADNQCVEAMNVDYWGSTLARKRGGTTPMGSLLGTYKLPFYSSASWGGSINTAIPISNLPSTTGSGNPSIKPLLFVRDTSGVMGVSQAASPYTTYVTTQAAMNQSYITGVEFRGVLYLTGSATRTFALECVGAPTFEIRKTGLGTPAAPTGADTGSGTYAATVRYYKVAYTVQRSGTTHRRSELSAALTFTPSGSGTGVVVTKPATISEGETHWELYGSADGTVYRLLATTAVATGTYTDTAAPSAYSGTAAPSVGANTVPGGWKYMVAHGNRLLGAGNWTAANPQSRVWYTPVYGASDVGDPERVPLTNYTDLDEHDGDAVTGMAGNFMGSVWVFKYRQVWKLIPTGDDDAPFQRVCLTKELGCIEHKTIAVGEDEHGNPALYFLSHRGPSRITASGGIQYCGRDIEDVWATRNMDASVVTAHAVYYNQRSQVWFWIATGTSTSPDTKLVFDVRLGRMEAGGVRGGWTRHDGASASSLCSAIWSPDGITSAMSRRLPVMGCSASDGLMLLHSEASGGLDNLVAFKAYVTTKPYALGGLGVNCSVGQSHLLAEAEAGSTITQTIVRDYGQETRYAQVDLTPTGSETRVMKQFEGSEMAGAGQVQFTLGDRAASASGWSLDALVVPYTTAEDR